MLEEMRSENEEMSERREGNALSTVMGGLSMAATAASLLRYLRPYMHVRSMTRWLGLRPRRTLWGSLALFGAGAVAGAGVAMFASPLSGRDTRRGLLRGVRDIGQRGREIVRAAGDQLVHIGESGGGQGQGQGQETQGRGKQGEGKHGEGQQGQKQPGRASHEAGSPGSNVHG